MNRKFLHAFRFLYVPIANLLHRYTTAPKRYQRLFEEIRNRKATSILEVGTWTGDRAVQMIRTAQRASRAPVSYVGFDLFEGLTDQMYLQELSKHPPSKVEVEEKLIKTGAHITLIQGNTLQTLPAYAATASPVDFIFIDGGHDKNTIQSDWDAVARLMHENSVVIFDDYWRNRNDQSAKPVVDAIDRTQFKVEILPDIDVFNNSDHGKLEISFAKVTLRKPQPQSQA